MDTNGIDIFLILALLTSLIGSLGFVFWLRKKKELKLYKIMIIFILCVGVFISMFNNLRSPRDIKNLQLFSKLCTSSASEEVFSVANDVGNLILTIVDDKYGNANDPMYDMNDIRYELYQNNHLYKKIYYLIDFDKTSRQKKSGLHIYQTDSSQLWRSHEHKSESFIVSENHRYIVKIDVEPLGDGPVRKLTLTIEDALNKKILARQNNYQILLGHFKNDNFRTWFGWGSSQAAESCPLSWPTDFISSVLRAS